MKRELGIARCGLACCLCGENTSCHGCNSGECPDKEWCENRKCTLEKGISHCSECDRDCKKGLLAKNQALWVYTVHQAIRRGRIAGLP